MNRAPTERFSDRVDNYARYRPGYPPALVQAIVSRTGLAPGSAAADLGAGTGLFATALLAAGLRVIAIEPNDAMRREALSRLGANALFGARAGTAESTGLPDGSVALVTAAQAFHWFDPAAAGVEARRIAAAGGHAALVWNIRREDTPFMRDYEQFLRRHCPEYADAQVPAQAQPQAMSAFFAGADYARVGEPNPQHFDYDGLRGRLLSSSYAPPPGAAGHEAMIDALCRLFDRHQRDGTVRFDHDAVAFVGRL